MKRLIIGCGYLGLRVANCWLSAGDQVFALSRNPARLRESAEISGIRGLRIIEGDITEFNSLSDLPDSDTVLFAVGMDRTRYRNIFDVYVDGLANVIKSVGDRTRHFIYISSTGVYGDQRAREIESTENIDQDREGAWVNEDSLTSPTRDGGKACLAAEQRLQNSLLADRTTILRFAGIYGPGRIPFKNAVEEKNWSLLSSAGFLNLIHVEDGAKIIHQISDRKLAPELFLVSDGEPVRRITFYETLAEMLNVGKIDWSQTNSSNEHSSTSVRDRGSKRVNNQKLIAAIDYQFLYPDFQVGLKKEVGGAG